MESIDRKSLVRRHNPRILELDPSSPLSIGNGELAYTADISGFQNWEYQEPGVPLCTMSQWGFHEYPDPIPREEAYRKLRLQEFMAGARKVGYMSNPAGQEMLYQRLRQSPHRANLFRLRLLDATTGQRIEPSRLKDPLQELDLWSGLLTSRYRYQGKWIHAEALCHPQRDLLAFRLRDPGNALLADASFALGISFPYPSHEIEGSDWDRQGAHKSLLLPDPENEGQWIIERRVDDFHYVCRIGLGDACNIEECGTHDFLIRTRGSELYLSVEFLRGHDRGNTDIPAWQSIEARSAGYWEDFWSGSAAIELWQTEDPRAQELERRIILSRYLCAIHCAGSLPPQETGLVCNSWYGKFHLEMHIWHALFFPLWGRPEMLRTSFAYYERIADLARERARSQGYRGLRWPKMTDPQGFDSPSPIGTLLCWQQPHFTLMAELIYQLDPDQGFLERYAPLVLDAAEFMADYPVYHMEKGVYELQPPLIPAQENHAPEDSLNPTFEIEYWRLGLKISCEWARRLGKEVPEHWLEVLRKLAPPPQEKNREAYAAHEACEDSYGSYAKDHPAMVFPMSFFQGERIDHELMGKTLDLVKEVWDFDSAWGWDFPSMAMCAARLGRREEAIDFLLMEADKNRYLPNGHNAQHPRSDLPLYLPGNGALLLAVAMMAAGWKGSEGRTPGFPKDWKIRVEGFRSLPF